MCFNYLCYSLIFQNMLLCLNNIRGHIHLSDIIYLTLLLWQSTPVISRSSFCLLGKSASVALTHSVARAVRHPCSLPASASSGARDWLSVRNLCTGDMMTALYGVKCSSTPPEVKRSASSEWLNAGARRNSTPNCSLARKGFGKIRQIRRFIGEITSASTRSP